VSGDLMLYWEREATQVRAENERLRSRLAEAERVVRGLMEDFAECCPEPCCANQPWNRARAFLDGKPNDAAQAAARTLLGDEGEGEVTPSPTVTLRETDTHLVIAQRGSEVVLTRADALKLAEGIRLVCGKEG